MKGEKLLENLEQIISPCNRDAVFSMRKEINSSKIHTNIRLQIFIIFSSCCLVLLFYRTVKYFNHN